MGKLLFKDLQDFFEIKDDQYNRPGFIDSDPIQIPHRYQKKEDIEIVAFLTSLIAWGQRSKIIQKASMLCAKMGESPHEYLTGEQAPDFEDLRPFVYRTLTLDDIIFFLTALRKIYLERDGLEALLMDGYAWRPLRFMERYGSQ